MQPLGSFPLYTTEKYTNLSTRTKEKGTDFFVSNNYLTGRDGTRLALDRTALIAYSAGAINELL
jgi:hypothetical protein